MGRRAQGGSARGLPPPGRPWEAFIPVSREHPSTAKTDERCSRCDAQGATVRGKVLMEPHVALGSTSSITMPVDSDNRWAVEERVPQHIGNPPSSDQGARRGQLCRCPGESAFLDMRHSSPSALHVSGHTRGVAGILGGPEERRSGHVR